MVASGQVAGPEEKKNTLNYPSQSLVNPNRRSIISLAFGAVSSAFQYSWSRSAQCFSEDSELGEVFIYLLSCLHRGPCKQIKVYTGQARFEGQTLFGVREI